MDASCPRCGGPAWTHQSRAICRDCGKDYQAAGESRRRPVGRSAAPAARVDLVSMPPL